MIRERRWYSLIPILEETQGYLVCIKPVGLRSQGEDPDCLPQLLARQTGSEIYPVHRLDQAVGGVMVFAKTKKAASKLAQAIQENRLQKEYLAVLGKRPEKDAGELRDLLFHDRFKNKTFVVSRERKGVKEARLSYRVLAQDDSACLVHVTIHTGRTHQIRVQFASRGCALLGDGKYGSRTNAPSPALWSYALTLPLGAKTRRICALPASDGVWQPFAQTLSGIEGSI